MLEEAPGATDVSEPHQTAHGAARGLETSTRIQASAALGGGEIALDGALEGAELAMNPAVEGGHGFREALAEASGLGVQRECLRHPTAPSLDIAERLQAAGRHGGQGGLRLDLQRHRLGRVELCRVDVERGERAASNVDCPSVLERTRDAEALHARGTGRLEPAQVEERRCDERERLGVPGAIAHALREREQSCRGVEQLVRAVREMEHERAAVVGLRVGPAASSTPMQMNWKTSPWKLPDTISPTESPASSNVIEPLLT